MEKKTKKKTKKRRKGTKDQTTQHTTIQGERENDGERGRGDGRLNEMDSVRLTWIEGGRVDSCGIDGRTLSAVGLGGIHSDGRRCDVARQTSSSASRRQEGTWRTAVPAERRVLI